MVAAIDNEVCPFNHLDVACSRAGANLAFQPRQEVLRADGVQVIAVAYGGLVIERTVRPR